MTVKKVIGFYKKDLHIFKAADEKTMLVGKMFLKEQVPVVTVDERDSQVRKACIDGFTEGSKAGKGEFVEWLEKWCKKQVDKYGLKGKSKIVKNHNELVTIYVKDLLSAVRKQNQKRHVRDVK